MTQQETEGRAVALSFEGFRLLGQFRFAEAESALLEALALNGAVPEELKRLTLREDITEDLGQLCLRTGRWEEALHYLEDSLKCNLRQHELEGGNRGTDMALVRRHKDLGNAYLRWALSSDEGAADRALAAQKHFMIAVPLVARLWVENGDMTYESVGALLPSLARGGDEAAPSGETYYRLNLVLVRAELHQEVGAFHGARGFMPQALNQYRQAAILFRGIGRREKQAECLVATARLQLRLGDLAGADRSLHEAQGTEGAPTITVEHVFAQVRSAQAETAETPVEREALLRDGLRHAIKALLGLDEYRRDLRTEQKRLTWRREVAAPAARLAFTLAEKVGDPLAMADLITVSRLSGILELAGNDITASGPGPLDLHADPSAEGSANREGIAGDGGGDLIAGSGSIIGLGLDALFRRRPVPPLRMPDGRLALGAFADGPPTPGEVIRYA